MAVPDAELRELADNVRAWAAHRQEVVHAEVVERENVAAEYDDSEDWAVSIVRQLQDILGEEAAPPPLKIEGCDCESCADVAA